MTQGTDEGGAPAETVADVGTSGDGHGVDEGPFLISMNVADVVFDEELYPRASSSMEIIKRYRMNIDGLPPIVVTDENILVDGYHRLAAYRQEGRSEIPAVVVQMSRELVLVEAIRLNAQHGEQLSSSEKEELVIRLHKEALSDECICEILSVHPKAVERALKNTKREEKEERNEKAWELHLKGQTQKQIGKEIGVTHQAVSKILATKRQMSESCIPDPLRVFNIWNFPQPTTEYGDQHRFGGVDPQVYEHILHYFSQPDDLIVDPMAGAGIVIDVCHRYARRCLAYDISPVDKRVVENDIREGIPEEAKGCDIIILDPPYYNNKVEDAFKSVKEFYEFIRRVAEVAKEIVRANGTVIFIMTDGDRHRFIPFIDGCHGIFRELGFETIARISSPLPTNTSAIAPVVARAKENRQVLYRDRVIHVYRRPE